MIEKSGKHIASLNIKQVSLNKLALANLNPLTRKHISRR